MLWLICWGQPKCRAIHPSQTVIMDRERIMMENQSWVLIILRGRVGMDMAAKTAKGTVSMAYSGSKACFTRAIVRKLPSAMVPGMKIWGARSHLRQFHSAIRANG